MRNILREQRKSLNLTQGQVAKEVGISRSAYTNVETGIRNPSFTLSLKLKSVLGYHSDDIFQNSVAGGDYECRTQLQST